MTDSPDLTGRARVRALLIDPLTEAGMVRRSGMTVDQHSEFLAQMADRLSYMAPLPLAALVEYLPRIAGGKHRDQWPKWVSIWAAAVNLQTPPPRKSSYAQSIIKSVMGSRAEDGGYLVELYREARRLGPPPNQYLIYKLREQADQNRRRRARIREYIEAGTVSPDDLRWLEAYQADLADAAAIRADSAADRAPPVISPSPEQESVAP